jgi:SAM-dependent methyltransferase
VGSGLGFEGVTFAQEEATVTFVDVSESNLEVVRRVCQLLQLGERTSFIHLKDLDSFAALAPEYDVMWCNSCLHHAPFEIVRAQAQELLRHLRPGGRWIQLAYPRGRWEREGSLPFNEWGQMTDGEATPWVEWYDLEKVLALLAPCEFNVVVAFEFHNGDFIWFDLKNVPSAEPWADEVPASFARLVSGTWKENERLRRQIGQLEEVAAETRKEAELHRERLVLLCKSRWRKLGMRLGIAMRPYWEDEYRTRS